MGEQYTIWRIPILYESQNLARRRRRRHPRRCKGPDHHKRMQSVRRVHKGLADPEGLKSGIAAENRRVCKSEACATISEVNRDGIAHGSRAAIAHPTRFNGRFFAMELRAGLQHQAYAARSSRVHLGAGR